MFSLDPRLEQDTWLVGDLPVCQVLLMNDSQFPWLILVPRRADAREVYLLDAEDQHAVWQESALLCKALQHLFSPEKLNVAALGNVVAQLHIHHVARFSHDCAWPAPVWGRQPAIPYTHDQAQQLLSELRAQLPLQDN